ncbi:hypothetical protein BDR07DRAFT_783352 [Suillus spraguei]|nr:hypothetical protein BDR07DRAFT_783352 [Suillus spraguei]
MRFSSAIVLAAVVVSALSISAMPTDAAVSDTECPSTCFNDEQCKLCRFQTCVSTINHFLGFDNMAHLYSRTFSSSAQCVVFLLSHRCSMVVGTDVQVTSDLYQPINTPSGGVGVNLS